MTRGLVSLLSLFLLSATAPTGLYAFRFSQHLFSSTPATKTAAAVPRNNGRTSCKIHMTSSLHRPSVVHEDGLRFKGRLDVDERARLAESIAEEFRFQLAGVKAACEAQHKMDLAQQRVDLLKDMVPLAAHEAIVESLASGFPRKQQSVTVQEGHSDTSASGRASSKIRDMSESLASLKEDVASLRTALGSHDEAHRALAARIRATEVEPQRLRADAAENDLSELRQATHGWLSAAHALKLEAVAEARESGHADGYAEGRAELQAARASFSGQLAHSRREVAVARSEAFDLVAAAGSAGTAALVKSRDFWRANGRAEGIAAAAGAAGQAGAPVAVAVAVSDTAEVREAFAAYAVSAHEQKLSAVAAEREASQEVARGLSRELAESNEMLATLLKERTSEMDVRHDSALNQIAHAASGCAGDDATAAEKLPSDVDLRGGSPWPVGAGAAAAAGVAAAVTFATSTPFWQECGGGK